MSNTTTHARAFRLTRRDGAVMAFTDHDRPITSGGVTYAAETALAPSEAAASLGMGADDQEISGALSSDAITENDIAAGLYDGAEVVALLIDWTDPELAEVLGVYTLGEVSRTQAGFTAELRGRSAALGQRRGRYCTATCDAQIGDHRCKVNLITAAWRNVATVAAITGDAEIEAPAIAPRPDGFFSSGRLSWMTGANAGTSADVRLHMGGRLSLWVPPPFGIEVGDSFVVTAGCDKSYRTCRDTFANTLNFRGFPTISGSEAMRYAVPGASAGLDGGSGNAL